jgi:hypothetical protein
MSRGQLPRTSGGRISHLNWQSSAGEERQLSATGVGSSKMSTPTFQKNPTTHDRRAGAQSPGTAIGHRLLEIYRRARREERSIAVDGPRKDIDHLCKGISTFNERAILCQHRIISGISWGDLRPVFISSHGNNAGTGRHGGPYNWVVPYKGKDKSTSLQNFSGISHSVTQSQVMAGYSLIGIQILEKITSLDTTRNPTFKADPCVG